MIILTKSIEILVLIFTFQMDSIRIIDKNYKMLRKKIKSLQ
jgi:hypothetical protein